MSIENAEQRVTEARRFAEAMARVLPNEHSPYGFPVGGDLQVAMKRDDGFLYEAYLNVKNSPLYFHEFVELATTAGLAYLGDAGSGLRWMPQLPPETERTFAEVASDRLAREQLVDFLVNQSSRYSLICRQGVELSDDATTDFESFYFAADLQVNPVGTNVSGYMPVNFVGPTRRARLTVSDPSVKAALLHLSQAWPDFVAFPQLREAVAASLGAAVAPDWPVELFRCYTSGAVEMRCSKPRLTMQIASHPKATAFARHQAESGEKVTNLLHRAVELTENERLLLRHLDGQRDQNELAQLMVDSANDEQTELLSQGQTTVIKVLSQLAKKALLIS